MRSAKTGLARFLRDCKGATAVEYGLIVAMIVLAVIASVAGVADATTGMWSDVSEKVREVS